MKRDRLWINEASSITDEQWSILNTRVKDLKYQIPGKENKRMLVEVILCFLLLPICITLIVLIKLVCMFIVWMHWSWAVISLLAIAAFVVAIRRIVMHIIKN